MCPYVAPDGGTPSTQTVGVGDITNPALGPAPSQASKVGGAMFTLVKNWDFGATGTIKNTSDLVAEFNAHDHWNTIANGSNYGAVTVAATDATKIKASGFASLPDGWQPVDKDPSRPFREFTASSLKTYVRPLLSTQTSCTVSKHDCGNGSLTAKWHLPKGGAKLGRDLLWETRVRLPKPERAFWFALWTAGTIWDRGAEMDVVESFGTPNIGTGAKAFHVNSVGGSDQWAYSAWPPQLDALGVPAANRDLAQWHTFTWVYLKDDTYKVYFDSYLVQQGTIHWNVQGSTSQAEIDMFFLFDLGWGHTQISDVNITLPAETFPLTYEVDYSRVYLR